MSNDLKQDSIIKPPSDMRARNQWWRAQEALYDIGHGLHVREQQGGFVIPAFQRGLVWSVEQKIRFVESLWLGLPIGSYCVNRDYAGGQFDRWLLDGQQRWSAIYSYVDDELEVFGYRFSELSDGDKRSFERINFTCMLTNYTGDDTEATLREIFERLAYGGTSNVRPSGA